MSARASIHAMFPLDEAATAELDTRLDALVAEELRAAAADLELRARSGGSRQRGLTFARALLRARADGITPTAPRRNIRHREVAEALRARPGEWEAVGDYGCQQSANGIARTIRGGPGPIVAYQPAGAFHAYTERCGDGVRVYARYVGADGGGA
ncbi:hypothetical protein GCM10023084_02550 [Streptomyces lacrimifluminis]|uniref:hypothetical protein n=1 Tax=Streptomyces lacrimifluminis TaxID=1500077 RepID=UPI0031E6BCBE